MRYFFCHTYYFFHL
jgi:hypothetical protein